MLDHPEKTPRLLAALKAAAPFEVELAPTLIDHLKDENLANSDRMHRVWDLSYAGDEGGIMCHMARPQEQEGHSLSLLLMSACRVRCRLHGLSPTTRNIE